MIFNMRSELRLLGAVLVLLGVLSFVPACVLFDGRYELVTQTWGFSSASFHGKFVNGIVMEVACVTAGILLILLGARLFRAHEPEA